MSIHHTILFVDDEEALRKVGKMMLEHLHYNVLLASDGNDAIQLYEKKWKEISVMILDVTMPQMGKECIEKILTINPHAKFILSSGFTDEALSKELIKLYGKYFLHKPYSLEILQETLSKVLKESSNN